MADIELVVKISEDSYNATCNGRMLPPDVENVVQGIKNGTPLPKGHGRLIDESKITKCEQVGLVIKNNNVTRCLVTDAPTIIEADKRKVRKKYADSD